MEATVPPTDFDREAYRQRIKLVRKLYGLNQMQFASLLGIPYKRWNHYECGYRMTSESVFQLRGFVKGLSADWLWWGKTGAMPESLLDRINRLQRHERRSAKAIKQALIRPPKVRKRIRKINGQKVGK